MKTTLLPPLATLLLLACTAREPAPGATPAAASTPAPADPDRTGTVLPGGRPAAAPLAAIRVEAVKVVQEVGHSVTLDVTYTYEGAPPPDQVQLSVLADMPYHASTFVRCSPGRNTARLTVELYEPRLKKDGLASFQSSRLTVSFRHYAPDSYKGVLLDEVIPFVKTWRARA